MDANIHTGGNQGLPKALSTAMKHDAESNTGTNMGREYTKYMISNVHRFTVYYYM